MYTIPFQAINWASVQKTEHKGISGTSFWQTITLYGLRLRIVEYSPGYLADHWCQKGHIVYCLEGEFINELQNGAQTLLTAGMSYVVSNELSSHRSQTASGAKLLIIDGVFLNPA